jgi:hypothetical protein
MNDRDKQLPDSLVRRHGAKRRHGPDADRPAEQPSPDLPDALLIRRP